MVLILLASLDESEACYKCNFFVLIGPILTDLLIVMNENQDPAANDSMSVSEKPRILIVDDSKVLRRAAAKILGVAYDVVLANDGEDGWEKIAVDDSIQVVFSDLSMPVLDGYGLLERIRSSDNARISELPVIIVTGGEGEEARIQALDMGATDFITKPFDTVDLTARAKAHVTAVQVNQDLQAQKQRLSENSNIDSLTGLGNKQHFIEKLKQDRSFTSRHKLPLSVMAVEIDNYRQVFVKHGKVLAEGLVKQLAKVILKQVRQEDTAARISVAAMAVSLPTATAAGCNILAERLRSAIEKAQFKYNGKPLSITVSVAIYTPSAKLVLTAEEILGAVSETLKLGLSSGGNQVLVCAQSDLEEPKKQEETPLIINTDKVSGTSTPEGKISIIEDPNANTGAEIDPDSIPMFSSIAKNDEEPAFKKDLSLESALEQIKNGHGAEVAKHLDELLNKLSPLFKLMNDEQKEKIINSLSS